MPSSAAHASDAYSPQIGSALARVTHRALVDAGMAIFERGDFAALADGMPGERVDELLARGGARRTDPS